MKKTYSLVTGGLTVVIAIALLMLTSELTNAKECRIIRLYGGKGGNIEDVRIEPKTIWIAKGDCVVWVNWIQAPEVQIVFKEGKKCEDLTMNGESCYVTSFVSAGDTSSLRFTEEGTLVYEVRITGGTKESGEIVVR